MSEVSENEFPFRPGHVVGARYRIVRVLNAGGIGVVYEAEHTFNGLRVALKALYNRARDHAARMHGEARVLAELRHPNIVQVTDGGVTAANEDGGQGIVWFTMELLEGVTLRQELARIGSAPVERALRLGIQLARGVAQAHARGVLHRDIKPENIFVLDPGDTVKVLDFGISKLNEATRKSSGLKTTDRFRILGTEAYLAPEALRADKLGPPADIYSMGHVLYEMIAGIHCWSEGPGPLDFPPKHELGTRQIFAPPIPLAERAPRTPSCVDQVVMQALEKHPSARQQSMDELAEALERALAKYRSESHPSVSSPVVAGASPKHTVRLETKTEEIPAIDADVRASGPVAIVSSNSGVSLDNALMCGAARFVSSSAALSNIEKGMRVLAEVEARVPQYRGLLRTLACMGPRVDDRTRGAAVRLLETCGGSDPDARVGAIHELAKRLMHLGVEAGEGSEIRGPELALGASQLIEPAHRLDSAESAIMRLKQRDEDVQNFACTILVAMARTAPETHPAPRGALLALLLGSGEDSELARGELAEFVLGAAPATQLEEVDDLSVAQLQTSAVELEAQRKREPVRAAAQPTMSQPHAGMTPTPASMTTPANPIAPHQAVEVGGANVRGLVMTFAIAGAVATIVGLIALALRREPQSPPSAASPAVTAVVSEVAPVTAAPSAVSAAATASESAQPAPEPPAPAPSTAPVLPSTHLEKRAAPSRPTATQPKPAPAKEKGSKLPSSGLDDPGGKKPGGVAF